MSCYVYTHIDSVDPSAEYQSILDFAKDHNLSLTKTFEDHEDIKLHWTQRKIGHLIKNCQAGDTILVYEAAQLACSTSQILEILSQASQHQVHLTFVKYNRSLESNKPTVNTQDLLDLIAKIESDFISKRTTQALARRKAAGLPLGRPKGRGNKSLKLDKHRDEIKRYLSLGISKASIAKLVDCHPQTLYDWLDRNDLGDKTPANQAEHVS